jgi:hypothetical protein
MLFKESGKYAYGGTSIIPTSVKIWNNDFIYLVDRGQDYVIPGTISKGYYTLVTFDLEKYDKDPSYTHFYTALFTTTRIKEMMTKFAESFPSSQS